MCARVDMIIAATKAIIILHISLILLGSIFAINAPIIALILMMKSDVYVSMIELLS